jgi:hypothetical protein
MTAEYEYNSTKRLFELYKELTGIDLMAASENQKKEAPKK